MNGALQPPGWTERVRAASALVLAPHHDDEVLGCGGLIAQLAAAGAAVRVLFLTDGGGGGGGAEAVADRDAYVRRRREESARACEILGLAGCDHLDLPDGALEHHLDAAAEGIRRAVLTQRPELLLVPSPLEVSRDHRAAFAALHRLLAPLRDGQPDHEPLRGLRVLLYEVNHPAYPDLLVDVSPEREHLEKAMAAYASQEERHPYWNAGLGLRRFRTLSLAPGVEMAEGYRRLRVEDFSTRSLAQLARHLGGWPEIHEIREGPRVSVIVRTRDRPRLLAEALESLAAGSYRRAEIVLVNDGGAPPAVPAGFPLPVARVDLAESRGRAGAAEAGIAAATGDYVAFLDDDDLAAPEHLATLAGLVSAAGVRVAYTDAAVALYERRGRSRGGMGLPRAPPPLQPRFRPRRPAGRQLHPLQHPADRARALRRRRPVRPLAAVLRGLGLPDPPRRDHPVPSSAPGHLRVPALPGGRAPRLRREPPRARRLPGGQGAGPRQACRKPHP